MSVIQKRTFSGRASRPEPEQRTWDPKVSRSQNSIHATALERIAVRQVLDCLFANGQSLATCGGAAPNRHTRHAHATKNADRDEELGGKSSGRRRQRPPFHLPLRVRWVGW